MKNIRIIFLFFAIALNSYPLLSLQAERELSIADYKSKMQAGWLGQMAGVGRGISTEFQFNGVIIPEEEVPVWEQSMINQHVQDDIYVEMTFLKTLENYGLDVSIRQAGIDFANSEYMLWHANKYGRKNLRIGIAPPFSGHPKFNSHCDDIDYQIEADFSGLIAPGLPQVAIQLGETFGQIMNYGDGVYGGQFIGAMYAEAFFEDDIAKIVDAGLKCIPRDSQYAQAIIDVVTLHQTFPDDWTKAWRFIENKYNLNPDYRRFSCNGPYEPFNIDAKINGAYVVMGLLYGEGNMDKTITISMRCGQDSDCNPSNAAGILATVLGMDKLPQKYKTGIDWKTKFSYTPYNFSELLIVCQKLVDEVVVREGGRIEDGKYIIPQSVPKPSKFVQSWNAADVGSDVYFSTSEMKQLKIPGRPSDAYVTNWEVAGPYDRRNEGLEGLDLFDFKFAPEQQDEPVVWKSIPMGAVGHDAETVYLDHFYGFQDHCVAYLRASVWSPKKQTALFEMGSDDGMKVWLNDELVHALNLYRGHDPRGDVFEVTLQEGQNDILLKIVQGTGFWRSSLVVVDKETNLPLRGLKFN